MSHTTNRILEALPTRERDILAPLLRAHDLEQHDTLFEMHETVERVCFPIDAAISLVVPLSTGEMIETAMVGRDGMVGGGAVLAGRVSLNRAVVQLKGRCHICEVNALRNVLPQCTTLHDLIARHEQALFAQAQQSAACNITHTIHSRLARWLLRARDLSGSDVLELTQEYMAEMLGVGRTTVSLTAHQLQEAGHIKYRRGKIKIVDVEGLKESACECYEAVRLNYATLVTTEPNE